MTSIYGSAVGNMQDPPPPPAPRFKEFDRAKYRRLVREGETAAERLNAFPPSILQARDEAARLAEPIHRAAGWDLPLDDVLQFDDAALKELGLKRDSVRRAIEAREHVQEVKAQFEAERPTLEAKRVLGLHLERWVYEQFTSVGR